MTTELQTEKSKTLDSSVETRMSGFQRLGLGVAMTFYIVSIIWVFFIGKGAMAFDPDVTVLTLAHWQLEDGFREGIDKALRAFEKVKAARSEGQGHPDDGSFPRVQAVDADTIGRREACGYSRDHRQQ